MKHIQSSLLLHIISLPCAMFLFWSTPVSADATPYHLSAGEAVDLKWDSQNVTDCRASNNYYTNKWGSNTNTLAYTSWSAAPANFGVRNFVSLELMKPGSHIFRFNCKDDDTATRFWEDETLIVYPVAPTSLSNNSCSGLSRTLSWDDISWGGFTGTKTYVVRVTKPASESCSGTAPGGTWSALDSTTCQVTTTGTSVTFNTTSGTNYSWRVASRAGSLVSANTSSGSFVSDKYTAGTNFSCTVTPDVQLNFQP